MIKAIFQSTGFESGEFGKKGNYIFSDISEDNEPLADKYVFSQLGPKSTEKLLNSGFPSMVSNGIHAYLVSLEVEIITG